MTPENVGVTRVQTGVRLEARMLNVLKALAALKGMTLGDLIEGIVLHAFEGEGAFSDETLAQIRDLKKVYGLKLRASDSHLLVETSAARAGAPATRGKRKKP
ncbi:MAG: hypothetical protein ACREV5_00400 [Steroidobacter sp.]